MSEKRFILSVNEDAPNTLDIIDIVADKTYNFVNDVVSMNQAKQLVYLLNELATKCSQLEKDNEQLSKEHQEMLEKYLLLRLKIGEVLNDE